MFNNSLLAYLKSLLLILFQYLFRKKFKMKMAPEKTLKWTDIQPFHLLDPAQPFQGSIPVSLPDPLIHTLSNQLDLTGVPHPVAQFSLATAAYVPLTNL